LTQAELVEGVLHGRDRSLKASLLRGLLTVAAWLHRVGLEIYLLPFRLGVRKRTRLPVPVVAIGNLTSGGTGKTPMAALVASRLHSDGRKVVLLSRGHGAAKGKDGPRMVSNGENVLLDPGEAGDEPTLLARLLAGVPVVVGKDRRQSGARALSWFAPDVFVLDDALQFWQLERDLDIVLLDAARPFDNGHILPRGLLREPPSHLSRAGVVVLTRADRVEPAALEATRARVQRLAPRADVFTATHAPVAWVRAQDGGLLPTHALAGREVCAFAGIADCGAFVGTVESLGARAVFLRDFGDHHAYTPADVAELAKGSCDAAVTTEKDLVKVGALWPHESAPPLYALRIGMKLDDPARFLARVKAAVEGKRPE
jgi:tetraacyldisaccharide 4'-kinase